MLVRHRPRLVHQVPQHRFYAALVDGLLRRLYFTTPLETLETARRASYDAKQFHAEVMVSDLRVALFTQGACPRASSWTQGAHMSFLMLGARRLPLEQFVVGVPDLTEGKRTI